MDFSNVKNPEEIAKRVTLDPLGLAVITADRLRDLAFLASNESIKKQIVSEIAPRVELAARSEKAAYFVGLDLDRLNEERRKETPPRLFIDLEAQLIYLFQQKFAGCKITYVDNYVEDSSEDKTPKKGILINWA
jgi:hypothetical protein